LTVSPPWLPTRFDEDGIAKVIQRFFGTLTNVYSFFVLYANIDRLTGNEPFVPIDQRTQIDRWIISKLNKLIREIEPDLNRFEITKSARMISNFVIDDLSNWYVRRCRRRFWKPSETDANGKMGRDKLSAYQTLHLMLLTISKMIAPFIPFIAEELYQNLKIASDQNPESVHLCFYPNKNNREFQYRDRDLEEKMELVLRTVNLGRSIRNEAAIKIRQPLQELIIYNPQGHQKELIKGMENLIKEELNVKEIRFTSLYSDLVISKAEPIYKTIGPKFGKLVNKAAEKIRLLSETEIDQLEKEGDLKLDIDKENFKITNNDIEIRTENREGLIVDSEENLTIALNIVLTESLINEGQARDFVNRVQNMRKEADFHVTDRILIHYEGSEVLQQAITSQAEYIKNETLADKLIHKIEANDYQKEWDINEERIVIGISRC
jgi:isoleucyl-tRNA synthetase